jgi:hypothetical protein
MRMTIPAISIFHSIPDSRSLNTQTTITRITAMIYSRRFCLEVMLGTGNTEKLPISIPSDQRDSSMMK